MIYLSLIGALVVGLVIGAVVGFRVSGWVSLQLFKDAFPHIRIEK